MNIFDIENELNKSISKSESFKPKSEADDSNAQEDATDQEEQLGIPSGDLPDMGEEGDFDNDTIDEVPDSNYDNFDTESNDTYDYDEQKRELESLGDISENSVNLAKNINEQYRSLLDDQTFNIDTFNATNIYSFENSEALEKVRTNYNNAIESLESYIKTDLLEDSISTRTRKFLEYKKMFHDLNVLVTELLDQNRD